MAGAVERIQGLDAIEKDIITCLQSAGECFFFNKAFTLKI